MQDAHVTRDLLAKVEHGDVPAGVLVRLGLRHVMALCPTCAAEFGAYRGHADHAPAATSDGPPRDYDQLFARLSSKMAAARVSLGDPQRADRELRELLRLPPGARQVKVRRAVSRFRGPRLVVGLLAEARRLVFSRPEESVGVAALAEQVAERIDAAAGSADLRAQAMAVRANAHRVRGELRVARELFAGCRALIDTEGVVDPLVLAEIDSYEGSLAADQRRLADAADLLVRAAVRYRIAGNDSDAVRPVVTLGAAYYLAGQLESALAAGSAACEELERQARLARGEEIEPRLLWCARLNLALVLVELGRFEEARTVQALAAALVSRLGDDWSRLRASWLEGKIAYGLGDLDRAEQVFREIHAAYLAQGNGLGAAQVSLDLALICLRRNDAAQLISLAEEMVRLFAAAEVRPEALAAVTLFVEGARAGSVTATWVRSLASVLSDPRSSRHPESP